MDKLKEWYTDNPPRSWLTDVQSVGGDGDHVDRAEEDVVTDTVDKRNAGQRNDDVGVVGPHADISGHGVVGIADSDPGNVAVDGRSGGDIVGVGSLIGTVPGDSGGGALAGDSTTAVGNVFDGSDVVTTIVGPDFNTTGNGMVSGDRGDGVLTNDSTAEEGNVFDGSDVVTTIVGAGTGFRCGADPVTIDNGQSGRNDGYPGSAGEFDRVNNGHPGVNGDDVHGSTLIVGRSDGVDGQDVSVPGNLVVDDNEPRGVIGDATGQGNGQHGPGNTANSDRNQPIGRGGRRPSGRCGDGDWSRRYTCDPTVPDRPRRYTFGQTYGVGDGSRRYTCDPNDGDRPRRYTCGQRSDEKPRRSAIGYDEDQWSGRRRRPGSFESTPKKDMISEAGHEPDTSSQDPMIAGDPLSSRLPLDRPRRTVRLPRHLRDYCM